MGAQSYGEGPALPVSAASQVRTAGPWVHRDVHARGVSFHVVVAGDEPGRPTVFLLHDFPLNWWSWREQIKALSDGGFRVIAMDLRGMGGSDLQPDSVELLDLPELRDQPMAVCGNPKNRQGIIVAKNEIAKKAGVKTAETVWQARKKCPGLKLVPPHHEKYNFYCKLINDIYYRYTDLVEPFSIDESWLDVSSSEKLFGSGCEIADHIRNTIKKELNLTLSVGVSFNKIFANISK